ncbi:group II intron reverse transcriptase/maturase [Subsaximicrobium wynnwilliamsii]|uniref:group II intron reverse transcriptase/maturase n=1 Tax=Subsaximicrobium wynnwilliamsii TaxID=291179 RepID=UPI0011BE4F06|nr:group II intron reverse transcriptase/maturase [Subsaximicrobium wynnwilliamsii]TXD99482.1 group II intron reverse transcriptase/maturase [Subsaximicrobium wynnwilliamsii]
MIKQLTSKKNLNDAYERVYRNKGSAGLDGVHITGLKSILQSQGKRYIGEIERETFQVSPILGVEIPKSNGKKRLLGISTVVDRVFQQALHQVMQPIFEPDFQQHSYGSGPERSAHQAIAQSLENINSGYRDIVDIDLKSFFDEVEHYILLELIYKKAKCKPTMKLLRSFLKAPILINGKLHKRKKGVPQGSHLSPLLSNILLNELDKELEKRGHRYVRYADDFSIYVKSEKSAKRVGNSIYKFLKDKLRLPINREKSGIRKPLSFQVLGFGFVPTYKKGEKGTYQLVVKPSKWKEFKAKLKYLTKKTIPASFEERIDRINLLIRGWINYFRPASIQAKLKKLEEWLRNRLRYCIWHHWKKLERKRKNLIRLGIDQEHAYAWSRTRMGGWAVAQSPILRTTITIKRLKMKGYVSLIEYYKR